MNRILDFIANWCAVIFVLFLSAALAALKIIGVITFSWWWVLSPLWLTVIAAVIILIFIFRTLNSKWWNK